MTGKIKQLGYSVEAMVKPEDVLQAAKNLDDASVVELAKYHYSTTLRGRTIFEKLVKMSPGDPDWEAEKDKAIVNSRFRYYYIDAHPHILIGELNGIFLKKSREFHYCVQRDELVRLNMQQDFDPVIQDEISNWNASGRILPPDDKSITPYVERDVS